jgi:hypothetical protein
MKMETQILRICLLALFGLALAVGLELFFARFQRDAKWRLQQISSLEEYNQFLRQTQIAGAITPAEDRKSKEVLTEARTREASLAAQHDAFVRQQFRDAFTNRNQP